jgi:MarR family transcriptional regulator, 2-MHQ and catechol-resistance regulon repressor
MAGLSKLNPVPDKDSLSAYAERYLDVYPWADAAAIELWSRVGAAYVAQRAAQERLYKSFGLEKKHGRFAVLRALYFAPGHRLTQFEIGNDAKVTSTHVTYLIDSLEEDGLAERSPHPSDRRMVHVELTPDGLELCQRLVPAMAEFIGEISAGLSSEEKVLLNRLLERLRSSADASNRGEN